MALINSRGIVALTEVFHEAFYYHGLTDREPFVHTLTIYSGYNAYRLIADGSCKVYTVKHELLDIGKIKNQKNRPLGLQLSD